MSGEHESFLWNKISSLLRFFDEVWTQGRREVIKEIFPQRALSSRRRNHIHGPAEFIHVYDIMYAQFSEISINPIVSLGEGDLVCVHWASTASTSRPARPSISPALPSRALKMASSSKAGKIGTPPASHLKSLVSSLPR